MSLYNKFNELFTSDKLKNKNSIKMYFEGIPQNNDEKISYTNILVEISSNKKDEINFISENYLKINDEELTIMTNRIKDSFKIKNLSQETFIIDKCLKETNLDNEEIKIIKPSFIKTINIYKSNEKSLNYSIFINFCAKLAYFIKFYKNLLNLPTIVYFGNITKARLYLLNFFNNLGNNIIIINTSENNPKQMISILEKLFDYVRFEIKDFNFKIPDKEIITAIETNAYKAEQQVNSYYDSEVEEINDIENIPVKTSYSDLFNFWKIPVNERNGYKIKNGIKYIPNITCKINGIEKDEEQFKNKLQELLTRNSFLILDDNIINNIDNMKESKQINLSVLKKNVRNILINKNFDEKLNLKTKVAESLGLYLSLFDIQENKFLNLIQQMDRNDYNPKLIIFHNSDKLSNNIVQFTEFYKLCQSIGFDIIMISPSGYSGIEEELENCNLYELDIYDSNFKFNVNKQINKNRKQETNIFKRLFSLGG